MRPLPISREEFARVLQRTCPPPGWAKQIGVANSGGPDSTCLLFLIHRYISHSSNPLPSRVFSLTVNHALQPAAASMARQCARTAAALNVPHFTSHIPWGTPPFPPRPGPSESLEATARLARYRVLWNSMRENDIDILAVAHHADDQVETALMRLGRQSSELGGRGMLGCRRWGMGMDGLAWVGHEGMDKWIIRPLLEFPKDRILATCEENKLEYITDPTNFQPDITLRNALRAIIRSTDKGETPPDLDTFPPDIAQKLKEINTTISTFHYLSIDLYSTSDRLRGAVKTIDTYANDIESQATRYLEQIRLPSPPGTFLLSTRALSTITKPLVRRAIILRILRYISFHPWGSLRSQARRSKRSLDQIIEKVWHPEPIHANIKAFAAGAGVLWSPVVVEPGMNKLGPFAGSEISCYDYGGQIRRFKANENTDKLLSFRVRNGEVGWLATRQPPYRDHLRRNGIEPTVDVDLTQRMKKALLAWAGGEGEGPAVLEVLYDCRFLIKIDLRSMPSNLANEITNYQGKTPKIVIQSWAANWYWPKIVFLRNDSEQGLEETILHANIDSHKQSPAFPYLKPKGAGENAPERRTTRPITSNWITVSWIRSLDSH